MRIVVAEDLYLLRDGMVRLIEAYGHQVVATGPTTPQSRDAFIGLGTGVAAHDNRRHP
ncbi:DNA-binding response regulator, partial [Streptomyces sp. NPDC059616]